MKPVVFPYKLIGGRWSPMISAGIRVRDGWQPVEFFVDSGATYTILRAQAARDVGLDFASGRKVFAQVGDGSLIPVYLHDLPMQIGGVSFRAPLGFSERLGVAFNLLGRLGVFERFRICFYEKKRLMSFLPI